MKKILIIMLTAICFNTLAQNSSYKYWENKILSSVSFAKVKKSIEKEQFKISYDKSIIPKSLMDTLKKWSIDFDFANPNEKYRSTDVVLDSKLPNRQIILILKNTKGIFITYKHGGIGFHHHILWAELKNNRVNDIWIGVTFEELDSVNSIKRALSKKPEELNTNLVCF